MAKKKAKPKPKKAKKTRVIGKAIWPETVERFGYEPTKKDRDEFKNNPFIEDEFEAEPE